MWLETTAAALHASELAQALRGSIWLYPLINTGHVIGLALLLGAIAPLDLRLIGCWPTLPLAPLVRVLVPMALVGLLLAIVTGALLFATRPLDYLAEPLFAIKLGLLLAALTNALLLRMAPAWRLASVAPGTTIAPAWRICGLLSLTLWLMVIAAGRLLGYR